MVPLAIYLALFQVFVLQYPIQAVSTLLVGLACCDHWLGRLQEGLNSGLMPFGNVLGANLPKKASMPIALIVIGILGVGVTFAEPAIGALQAFGSSIDVKRHRISTNYSIIGHYL